MIWQKIESLGIAILAFLLCIAMAVTGWLMFLDGTLVRPVIEYESKILATDKSIYKPGDIVYAQIEFFKFRDLIGTQKWNLVNGRIIPYSPRQVSMPVGAVDKWIMIEKLPHCESGEYHFEGISSYQVNPLRTVNFKLRTKPFLIMNGPKEDR